MLKVGGYSWALWRCSVGGPRRPGLVTSDSYLAGSPGRWFYGGRFCFPHFFPGTFYSPSSVVAVCGTCERPSRVLFFLTSRFVVPFPSRLTWCKNAPSETRTRFGFDRHIVFPFLRGLCFNVRARRSLPRRSLFLRRCRVPDVRNCVSCEGWLSFRPPLLVFPSSSSFWWCFSAPA